MIDIFFATSDNDYSMAATLFNEYASWLNIDLSFQKFDDELLILKSMYGLPLGCIILAKVDGELAACVAVRQQESDIAELKRMYVKPAYRKLLVAQSLLNTATNFAVEAGYKKIRLDTLNTMTPAMNLYLKNGFKEIESYYNNPLATAVYFEKNI